MTKLLAQTNPFGNQGLQPNSARFQVDTSSADAANASALTGLERFISQMIGFLTIGASMAFILYFVMGAFKWTTAGGEASKVQKARDQMVQGVIGLILIVASYSIVGLVGTIVGIEILQPAKQLDAIFGTP